MNIRELEVVEVKGLEDVKVFRICESDAVAAYSLQEAKAYYKGITGLNDSDLYSDEDVEVIPLETKFWNDEEMTHKRTLKEMLEIHWGGDPQIVITWDI
ncbi:hypothetical protein [Rossellomorea sp. BNER]|uniref:hypothetical protein n=1 Tax=Rossellomorea sp. BNER TaxID=2962031 RepID=UPI003AF2C9F2|nr:hypothetical protein [Rossellomorea sp. BNER]